MSQIKALQRCRLVQSWQRSFSLPKPLQRMYNKHKAQRGPMTALLCKLAQVMTCASLDQDS